MRQLLRTIVFAALLFRITGEVQSGEMTVKDKPINIQGRADVTDSFTACIAAVLESWGRPEPYDYIAGLSGTAFTPIQVLGENCTAWWMEGGSDVQISFLGEALGFSVESHKRTGKVDWKEAEEAYLTTGEWPPAVATYLKILKNGLTENKIVIVRTWPSWSVLTGWSKNEDDLPFETVPGLKPLCRRAWGPHKSDTAYLLSPKTDRLDRKTATNQALNRGSRLAAEFEQDGHRYGGSLYTAAGEQLDEVHFCEACKEDDRGCATRTMKRMGGSVRSAMSFLENLEGNNGEALSGKYQEMMDIISPLQKSLGDKWPDVQFKQDLQKGFEQLSELHRDSAVELSRIAQSK